MSYKTCTEACKKLETSCPVMDCRSWIDYEEDFNCALITIEKNDILTLRDVAKRLKCSFVRVKQIEEGALKKLNIKINNKLNKHNAIL